MARRFNGGVRGKLPTVSTSSASGMWDLLSAHAERGASNWPSLLIVPGAPTSVSATAGAGQATVSFSAPSFLGVPASITGYRVTSNPGGFTATGANSPITVTGLSPGTAYTFTVAATNSTGYGTESSASSSVTPTASQIFSAIFGSATSFTMQTDNAWAVSYSIFSSYSSAYGQGANAFWSYISTATTAPNAGTSNWYDQSSVPTPQQTSTLSSPSVTNSAGYTTSESVNWSTPADGVWMGGNTSISVITANIGASDFTNAKYFMYRGYGSNYSYHNPYVIKITANGISRLFATQNLSGRANPTSAVYVAYFAPLNSSFTSFADSRLTSAGSTLDPSYFQWI
jgi:hypothetical protein